MSDKGKQSAERARQVEKRSHERYRIPAVYQRYISLRVKAESSFVPAVLVNFSRHGIMFESAAPYAEGSLSEGVISAPKLLTRDIAFSFRVKYCKPGGNSFEIGAEIESLADEVWFNIFMEVHDFIVQRKGVVY